MIITQTVHVRKTARGMRIWLEGKRLFEAGFTRGARYRRVIANSKITIALDAENGEKKVSGKGDRPIIDISGKQIEGFEIGDELLVRYCTRAELITIEKVAA